MNRKAVTIAALIALLPIVLAGCGGGGSGPGSPGSSIAPAETGSIKINIQWPASASRTIPVDANSILVTVAGKGMAAETYSITYPETQLTIGEVPVGQRTLKAEAFSYQYQYPSYMGTQALVAVGSVGVTVVKNQTVGAAIDLQPLTAAQQALENGRTELNNLMFNGVSSADPEMWFSQIPNTDDCFPEARFGMALTLLWKAMIQMGQVQPGGGGGPAWPPVLSAPMTAGMDWQSLDFSKLSQSLKRADNPFRVLLPTKGFDLSTPATRSDTPKSFQDDVKAYLLPALTQALAELAIAEADDAFSFRLGSGWYYPRSSYVQYSVHQGDVYLFDALMRAFRVEAYLVCAYNLDSGSFNFDAPASALDTNADGILTPAEYLPASPFLTLADPASLAAAKTDLLDACAKAIQGLNLAIAEGEGMGNYSVIDYAYIGQGDMVALRSIVVQVQQSMAGPITLPVPNDAGTANIQVYLGALFVSMPTDLRSLSPNLKINPDGSTDVIGSSFPDKTFGGMFPGGLPDYLLSRQ